MKILLCTIHFRVIGIDKNLFKLPQVVKISQLKQLSESVGRGKVKKLH